MTSDHQNMEEVAQRNPFVDDRLPERLQRRLAESGGSMRFAAGDADRLLAHWTPLLQGGSGRAGEGEAARHGGQGSDGDPLPRRHMNSSTVSPRKRGLRISPRWCGCCCGM